MQWLSGSGEEFFSEVQGAAGPGELDVLVVGSGYGGAVAALRFAQAGRSVTVLERGEEYVAGEFPNDISQAGGHVRAELASARGVTAMGKESALFDLRVGLRAGALVGNGLGGTSLINAGVGLRPDKQVFQQQRWPAALRQADLDRFFARAETELELQTPGVGDAGQAGRDILASGKLAALSDFAEAARQQNVGGQVTFRTVPIAVELRDNPPQDLGRRRPCNGCGDCVTGCNHGAKLSLTATYLPRAWKAGARLFTGITVLAVEHQPQHESHPWLVTFIRTAERTLAGEAGPRSKHAASFQAAVRVRTVILSAGTFGSTEILLRSRARGLQVSSTALGMQVSGNGDDVSQAYDLLRPVGGVGAGTDSGHGFVGPTIVGAVEFKDGNDFTRDTLVEDGAVPGLLATVLGELSTTLAAAAQLERWSYRQRAADALAVSPGAMGRTLTMLGMGHDSAGGTIAFDAASDRVLWAWPEADKEDVAHRHQARQSAVERLGAIFLRNPATGLLPKAVADVLSGPQPGGSVFTVHPLGGCRMGDNHHAAVVNDWGAVFRSDAQGVFEGLYVLDGSIVPTALGVNPLLTITALAERACELILRHESKPAPALRELAFMPLTFAAWGTPVTAVPTTLLTEVLRGPLHLQGAWPAHDLAGEKHRKPAAAALFVNMQVPDWAAVMADADHRVAVVPGATGTYSESRLEIDDDGRRTTLEVLPGSEVLLFRRSPSLSRGLSRWLALACTYLISRWIPDSLKRERPGHGVWLRFAWCVAVNLGHKLLPGARRRTDKAGDVDWIGGIKLLRHALEVREFEYSLLLRGVTDGRVRLYRLEARKRVDACASWGEIVSWWWRRKSGTWPPLVRRSVWDQLTQADLVLVEQGSGSLVARGRLAMDLPEIARRLTPQLGAAADTLTALLALAAYPLFIARVLLKTRLLDFRAPDYCERLPDTDPATLDAPPNTFELWAPGLELPGMPQAAGPDLSPDRVYRLRVRLSARDADKIDIGLIRFKPPGGVPAVEHDAHWERARVKSIVLINGFAQNTRAFVSPELGEHSLASCLHAQGWDVWLLEYRVSPLLRASARFSSMDDIAAYDIPRAVALVRRTVERQCGLQRGSSQVFAFSHCVGSASLAMSILGGQLADWKNVPEGCSGGRRAVPWLAGVLFSQFHPFVVGSATAQQRLQFGSLLHNVLQLDVLNFTAGQAKADLLHAMLDRVFASAPYAHPPPPGHDRPDQGLHGGERCPGEDNLFEFRSDSTTCKRMSGLLSRLFNHDQLHEATHRDLDKYFGRTNLGVFLHGARCVEYERLVSENGQNVYVTDRKIGRYLTMPVMLLHGLDNVLFDAESLGRTASQLRRAACGPLRHPGPPAVIALGLPGMAHFDCTIGKDAPLRVFAPVVKFFGDTFAAGGHGALPSGIVLQEAATRCMARVPRTGPLVGWVRKGGSGWLLRVWFEVDLTGADRARCGLTRLRFTCAGAEHVVVQSWALQFSLPLKEPGIAEPKRHAPWLREAAIGYCLADLDVPADVQGPVLIEALSVHCFRGRTAAAADADAADAAGLPRGWGVPLSEPDIVADVDPPRPSPGDADATGHLPQSAGAAVAANRNADHVRGPIANVPYGLQIGRDLLEAGAWPPLAPAQVERADGDDALAVRELGPLPLRVQPSQALLPAAFDALLATARAYETAADTVARRPDPGTLSRQRRKLSALDAIRVQWSAPAGDGLRFLAAACRHPGLTDAERDRADLSLHGAALAAGGASFMLMLGDQIYADARAGLFDSASEIERLVPRYRAAFGSSGFRALASRLPLAMILDDHEIGDNWSVEALGSRAGRRRRINALRAYEAFQRSHGSALPSNRTADAYFEHDGISFFLLDTRTGRRRSGQHGQVLRMRQWISLYRALSKAQADAPDKPKFICSGSVLAPGLHEGHASCPPRSVDSWQHSERERRLLLAMLARLKVRHAVLLSSDYHCSAAADIRLPGGVTVVALCAPPLHAPLVFANSQPADLIAPCEEVQLRKRGGPVAVVEPLFKQRGDGWLECRLVPNAQGWQLKAVFHLRDMQGPRALTFEPQTCQWQLGGPGQRCANEGTAADRLRESANALATSSCVTP